MDAKNGASFGFAGEKSPVVVFDGNCGFCRRWVGRWRRATGDRVEYVASQDRGTRFAEMPEEDWDGSVQLIDGDGRRYQEAEAVFRVLAMGAGMGWARGLVWAYARVPGFGWAADAGYRVVARHRAFFSWVERGVGRVFGIKD